MQPDELRARSSSVQRKSRRSIQGQRGLRFDRGELGCSRFTLREWHIQAERDAGERPAGRSSADKARIKKLERENKELRTANEILKKASAYFAQAETDRPFRR